MIQKDQPDETWDSDSNEFSVPELFEHLKSRLPELNHSTESFGKYRIQKRISARRNSQILLAYDPDLRRQVILKIYEPGLTQDHRAMILNEGQALSQIDCPHVARCLGVDEVNDCVFLVLEYISGTPLNRLHAPMAPAKARQIVRQIATAVNSVHDRGLLHLDLKPSNVMITDDGVVKLIDFGLAQPISNVRFGEVYGTPSYMAPEVANHEISRIDRRSDIFGIGAVLYSLVTGQPPFVAESLDETVKAAQLGIVTDARELEPRVDQATNEVCRQCLAKSPGDRYADANELARALAGLERSSVQRRWLLAATLVLALIGSVLIWRSQQQPPQFAGLKQTFVQLISNQATPAIANDFHVEARFTEEAAPTNADGVRHFDLDTRNVRLVMTPEIDCYIGVYSVQYEGGNADRPEVLPIGGNRGGHLQFVNAGHSCSVGLDFSLPTPDVCTEYFVVAARETAWESELAAREATAQVRNDPLRGVSNNSGFSEARKFVKVIPYRVVQADN